MSGGIAYYPFYVWLSKSQITKVKNLIYTDGADLILTPINFVPRSNEQPIPIEIFVDSLGKDVCNELIKYPTKNTRKKITLYPYEQTPHYLDDVYNSRLKESYTPYNSKHQPGCFITSNELKQILKQYEEYYISTGGTVKLQEDIYNYIRTFKFFIPEYRYLIRTYGEDVFQELHQKYREKLFKSYEDTHFLCMDSKEISRLGELKSEEPKIKVYCIKIKYTDNQRLKDNKNCYFMITKDQLHYYNDNDYTMDHLFTDKEGFETCLKLVKEDVFLGKLKVNNLGGNNNIESITEQEDPRIKEFNLLQKKKRDEINDSDEVIKTLTLEQLFSRLKGLGCTIRTRKNITRVTSDNQQMLLKARPYSAQINKIFNQQNLDRISKQNKEVKQSTSPVEETENQNNEVENVEDITKSSFDYLTTLTNNYQAMATAMMKH